jgi:hypothetical protein
MRTQGKKEMMKSKVEAQIGSGFFASMADLF